MRWRRTRRWPESLLTADSGGGADRADAIELGFPRPSLHCRARAIALTGTTTLSDKLLAAMRNQFSGHEIKRVIETRAQNSWLAPAPWRLFGSRLPCGGRVCCLEVRRAEQLRRNGLVVVIRSATSTAGAAARHPGDFNPHVRPHHHYANL